MRSEIKCLLRFSLVTLLFTMMLFSSNHIVIAMQPSDESLRDPSFLSQYDCTRDYFKIKDLYKRKKMKDVIKIINKLEHKGYIDRFLTMAKSKAFFRLGDFDKAANGFKRALGEGYKCKLVEPGMRFAAVPALADEAIVWYNLYETYEASGKPKEAADAFQKAKSLLKESMEVPADEFDSIAGRAFYGHSVLRDELPSP